MIIHTSVQSNITFATRTSIFSVAAAAAATATTTGNPFSNINFVFYSTYDTGVEFWVDIPLQKGLMVWKKICIHTLRRTHRTHHIGDNNYRRAQCFLCLSNYCESHDSDRCTNLLYACCVIDNDIVLLLLFSLFFSPKSCVSWSYLK